MHSVLVYYYISYFVSVVVAFIFIERLGLFPFQKSLADKILSANGVVALLSILIMAVLPALGYYTGISPGPSEIASVVITFIDGLLLTKVQAPRKITVDVGDNIKLKEEFIVKHISNSQNSVGTGTHDNVDSHDTEKSDRGVDANK